MDEAQNMREGRRVRHVITDCTLSAAGVPSREAVYMARSSRSNQHHHQLSTLIYYNIKTTFKISINTTF